MAETIKVKTAYVGRHRGTPIEQLCAEATDLVHRGDWPAIGIEPTTETVLEVDTICSDGIFAEFPNGQPHVLEQVVNPPYGLDSWTIENTFCEPAEFITPGWLEGQLFPIQSDGTQLTEPVIFQAEEVYVYDCDDCRDFEDADERELLQCDHLAGWSLVIARHV